MKKRDKRKLAIATVFLILSLLCVLNLITAGIEFTPLFGACLTAFISVIFFRNSTD